MDGLVWGLFTVAASACSDELSAFEASLDDAENALDALDSAEFARAVDRARDVLGCLGEPIEPALAARFHRAMGIRSFAARGPVAPTAFAAARHLEPDRPLSPTLFPPDSPVSEAWSAMSVEALRLVALPPPRSGWLLLDGTRGLDRAVDLPVVFQKVETDGTVSVSTYLLPGEAVPPYPIGTGRVDGPSAPVARAHPQRVTFAVAAVASGAAAAGLWGLAVQGRSRYLDLDELVPDDRLDGLQTRTNALAAGSAVGTGLCAVSGALLVATW